MVEPTKVATLQVSIWATNFCRSNFRNMKDNLFRIEKLFIILCMYAVDIESGSCKSVTMISVILTEICDWSIQQCQHCHQRLIFHWSTIATLRTDANSCTYIYKSLWIELTCELVQFSESLLRLTKWSLKV